MVDNDISHLPVVDAEENVTGMVTSTDLTACLTDEVLLHTLGVENIIKFL